MTHVTCRLTAKNRDQLRNSTLGIIEYGLPYIIVYSVAQRKWNIYTLRVHIPLMQSAVVVQAVSAAENSLNKHDPDGRKGRAECHLRGGYGLGNKRK